MTQLIINICQLFELIDNFLMAQYFATAKSQSLTSKQIRKLVQEQVYEILSSIKDQIEIKIKNIDLTILEIRNKINLQLNNSKHQQFSIFMKDINTRINQIQKLYLDLKETTIISNSDANRTRNKSADRNSLFKKTGSAVDITRILFGEGENAPPNIQQTNEPIFKNRNHFEREVTKIIKPELPQVNKEQIIQKFCKEEINIKLVGQSVNVNNMNEQIELKLTSKNLNDALIKNKQQFLRKKSQTNLTSKNIINNSKWKQVISQEDHESSISIGQ